MRTSESRPYSFTERMDVSDVRSVELGLMDGGQAHRWGRYLWPRRSHRWASLNSARPRATSAASSSDSGRDTCSFAACTCAGPHLDPALLSIHAHVAAPLVVVESVGGRQYGGLARAYTVRQARVLKSLRSSTCRPKRRLDSKMCCGRAGAP